MGQGGMRYRGGRGVTNTALGRGSQAPAQAKAAGGADAGESHAGCNPSELKATALSNAMDILRNHQSIKRTFREIPNGVVSVKGLE